MRKNNIKLFFIAILLFAIHGLATCQTKELNVYYSYNEKIEFGPNWNKKIELRANTKGLINKTIYEIKMANPIRDENGHFVSIDHYFKERVHLLYKDYLNNTMVSTNEYFKEKVVGENLDLFHWEFLEDTDTILGYYCRSAETQFRGRTFKAFFTTDIPFRAAPWKFHGLPGVMLKVESNDGFVQIEAKSISIKEQEEVIENPYQNMEQITYEEHVKIRKQKRLKNIERIKRRNALTDGPKAFHYDMEEIEIIEYENPK